MNYTENYQLPQWEESDRVLMADFNAMTQKIDQGLPRFITGSYTGTGEENVTKHYSLGGRPRLVVLRTENTYSGNTYDVGLILTEAACIYFNSNSAYMQAPGSRAGLEDDGFFIYHDDPAALGLNNAGKLQHYWAWM